jgi:hypothetical protein
LLRPPLLLRTLLLRLLCPLLLLPALALLRLLRPLLLLPALAMLRLLGMLLLLPVLAMLRFIFVLLRCVDRNSGPEKQENNSCADTSDYSICHPVTLPLCFVLSVLLHKLSPLTRSRISAPSLQLHAHLQSPFSRFQIGPEKVNASRRPHTGPTR